MKLHKYILSGVLTAAALALVFAGPQARAQVEKNTLLSFEFAPGANTALFADPTFVIWWGGGTVMDDPTTGPANNTPGLNTSTTVGSLKVVADLLDSQQLQLMASWEDTGTWQEGETANLLTYSNISFQVLFASSMPLVTGDSPADMGTMSIGFASPVSGNPLYFSDGKGNPVHIPAAAATGWQTITIPFTAAEASSLASVTPFGITFYYNAYGNNPKLTNNTFWLANIQLNPIPLTQAPPPPPTVLAPVAAVPGLNIIGTDVAGQDRTQIVNSNDATLGNCSFYGQANVTYSFTLSQFFSANDGTFNGTAWFEIISGGDSTSTAATGGTVDTSADWGNANDLFFRLQSNGTNAAGVPTALFQFSFKTNTVQQNGTASGTPGNLYYDMAQLTDVAVGTWSINFQGSAGSSYLITMTGPTGVSSNYTLADNIGVYFAETYPGFGVSEILGGELTLADQDIVYTKFSQTGNCAFTDTFTSDSVLNTSYWHVLAADPANGVQLVPSNAGFWLSWTLPAVGYALVESPSLNPPNWANVTPALSIVNNGAPNAMILKPLIPSGNAIYYALVQRNINNLILALPGQTASIAAGTGLVTVTGSPAAIPEGGAPWPMGANGMGGDTPAAMASYGGQTFVGGTILIFAVDANNDLVTTCTDTMNLYCGTDPNSGATAGDFTAPTQESAMVGGIGQFNNATPALDISWGNSGSPPAVGTLETVTIQDVSIPSTQIIYPATVATPDPLYTTIGLGGGVTSGSIKLN